MAERSKAQDSSAKTCHDNSMTKVRSKRAFWSTYVGVGSNPTPDKLFFKLVKLPLGVFVLENWSINPIWVFAWNMCMHFVWRNFECKNDVYRLKKEEMMNVSAQDRTEDLARVKRMW